MSHRASRFTRSAAVWVAALLGFSGAGCDGLGLDLDGKTVVTGVVVRAETGEPVPGLDVFMTSGCSWGACAVRDDDRTDARGRFRLEAASRHFANIWPNVYVNATTYGKPYVYNPVCQAWHTAGVGISIKPGSTRHLRVALSCSTQPAR